MGKKAETVIYMAIDQKTKLPWFEKGLRFQCTGCGACCTGKDGYVFLSKTDLANLANRLKLTEEEFIQRYTRLIDGEQLALLDRPRSGDCIFLKGNQCSVYEDRPVQCKTFPWWIHNLRSEKDWKEAAKRCEGINHPDAPIVSSLEIETECMTYLDNVIDQNFTFV